VKRLGIALRRLAPVGDAALAALAKILVPRRFPAGGWLLRAGERAEWLHFIESGLIREVYLGERGEEHTRRFLPEDHVTGSLLDLVSGEPAVTWIQALEPTTTLAWRYRDFNSLCDRFPDLNMVARRSAEALAVRKTRREHEMLALPAIERYRRWLAENAAIDARVTRRHLASYLGVTPEHLSRMRRLPRR
jgi:CRP-like cAMP-binding protein